MRTMNISLDGVTYQLSTDAQLITLMTLPNPAAARAFLLTLPIVAVTKQAAA